MASELLISFFSHGGEFPFLLKALGMLSMGILTLSAFETYLSSQTDQAILQEELLEIVEEIRKASASLSLSPPPASHPEEAEVRTELQVDASVFLGSTDLVKKLEEEHGVSIVLQSFSSGRKDKMTILGSTREVHNQIISAIAKEELKRSNQAQLIELGFIQSRQDSEQQAQTEKSVLVLPSTWERGVGGRVRKSEMVALAKDSEEWRFCCDAFYKKSRSNLFTITSIERVQNEELWTHYSLHKRMIENEKWLFHGTKQVNAKAICTHGFNRSYAGKKVLDFQKLPIH